MCSLWTFWACRHMPRDARPSPSLRLAWPLATTGIALFLTASGPALAQSRSIDMSKAGCTQFMALAKADKEQVLLWLAGFYAGAAQRPMLEIGMISSAAASLDELCAKAPATTLLGEATRNLLMRQAAP
jgi:hypothetical protein